MMKKLIISLKTMKNVMKNILVSMESDIGHQVGDPENVTHTREKFSKRTVPTRFIDLCRSPIFSKLRVGTLLVELEEPIYPGGDSFFHLQTSLRMLLLLT